MLGLIATLILAAWLLLFLRGRSRWPAHFGPAAASALLLLCLVQAWVALQLAPLPAEWLAWLSPRAHEWHLREGPLTLSLDVAATRYYLLRGWTVTAVFFLALVLVNTPGRLRLLLQTLVFCGTLQAVYGSLMVLTGLEWGFLVEKYAGRGVASGTFVNRNHFAAYLVMCLGAGIGLLMSQLRPVHYPHWRARLQGWLELAMSPRFRLRIYLAVMVIALVLSRSRSGNVIFFLALALAGGAALWTGRRFSWRLALLLGSLFAVDLLILSRWFGFDKLVARLEAMEGQQLVEIPRYWMDRYSLDYLRDFTWTGSGGGSFYGIFPNYQGPMVAGYVEHAHNDYLEFAVELGLPATVLLGAVVLAALFAALRAQRLRKHPLYRGAAFATTMAVCWAALHSFTDFSLQIPANAVTFAALLAVAFVALGLPGTKARRLTGNNAT